MQVKLKRGQRYFSIDGSIKFGEKDEIVNISKDFYKYIARFCEIVIAKKEEPQKKPLAKMNKEELLKEITELGIELTDEQKEETKKTDLIKLIQDFVK